MPYSTTDSFISRLASAAFSNPQISCSSSAARGWPKTGAASQMNFSLSSLSLGSVSGGSQRASTAPDS
jgi:hypothetical protein